MICLLDSYDISLRLLWDLKRMSNGTSISMIFLEDLFGNSMPFPWNFYEGSMIFLWDFYWIPVGFSWYFYDISMGLLWDF